MGHHVNQTIGGPGKLMVSNSGAGLEAPSNPLFAVLRPPNLVPSLGHLYAMRAKDGAVLHMFQLFSMTHSLFLNAGVGNEIETFKHI